MEFLFILFVIILLFSGKKKRPTKKGIHRKGYWGRQIKKMLK